MLSILNKFIAKLLKCLPSGLALGLISAVLFLPFHAYSQDAAENVIFSNPGHDRVIEVGQTAVLDGADSISILGQRLSYAWALIEKPDGSIAQLSDANSARPSLVIDLAGDYRAELVVTDSEGNSSTGQAVLLTTGNVPPVAMAGPDRFTKVGQPLSFDPEGTYDANGDRLSAVWSISSFPSESTEDASEPTEPANPGANNLICPVSSTETLGTYHVVSATSNQQSPHLAVGQPLAEGTVETGNNSATTYYGPITMDLTGDPSIFVPEGEVIEVVLSSAWGTSARAEILMSADGENYTSLGTVGNGGSVYGTYTSNVLRYDDFVVPAGGARFLQVSHQQSGVRADGVIYNTQCQSGEGAPEEVVEEDDNSNLASLIEDESGRFVFTPNIDGEYSIQLLVEDEEGARAADIVRVYVAPVDGADDREVSNIAPIANAGLSQLTVVGQAVVLDGSSSTDINGDKLSYQWSILSKPADSFSTIENATSARATITPDTDRTYVLQLAVTDIDGLTDYDTIVLSGDFITPFAVSGGPVKNSDGAINNFSASVDGSNSSSGQGTGVSLAYNWAVLGLSEGESEIENAQNVSTLINFPEGAGEALLAADAQDTIDLLAAYNLIVFGDMDSSVDTGGSALVGGNLNGNSATFGTQIPQGQNIDALSVVGNITGGSKNINNGGNVRFGGSVYTQLNLNGGGQRIEDSELSVVSQQAELLSLSSEIASLAPNSVAQIPSPSGQHGPGRLNATPDENGVAIFDIADGNILFRNDRVQQIEVNANGAETIIVNIGGADIDFNRGNFVGAIGNDDVRRRIIWNFHEATDLYFERAFHGALLAPRAHLFNRSDIFGTVIVDSLQARGPIRFANFTGAGLVSDSGGEGTHFALAQLAVSDTGQLGLSPAYSSTVLTTGNLRPLARIAQSGTTGSVAPGTEISFDGSTSFDGNGDALSYSWAILSKPDNSSVEVINKTASSVSITPDNPGLYIVQLTVSDGELVSRPVTLAFEAQNTAPTAVAGSDQTVFKNAEVTLDGSASSDPDGDELEFTWVLSEIPQGSQATLSDNTAVSPTFVADIRGEYVISLTVNDGLQDSQSDNVTVTVENRAPIAVATGTAEGFIGDIISLNGVESSDPDGDTLVYEWSVQAPDGSAAVLSNASSAAPMFTPDLSGTYTFVLVVNDGEASSAPSSFVATISAANRPPKLSPIGNKTVLLGSSASFQLFATDPDGDALSYFINSVPLPDGALFDASTGIFTFRPTSISPSGFTLTAGVSDGVLVDNETFSLNVVFTPTTSTEYSGRVIDAQTGEPINGALVSAGVETTRTNANGEFVFTGLPSGSILICIEADEATERAPNGSAYGSTHFTANLIENVSNEQSPDIKLGQTLASAQITPSLPTILEDSATLGVRLEIPADSISGATSSDIISLSGLNTAQANQLPEGVEPCQLFTVEPKSIQITQPLTLTVDNYDQLPAGASVDIWVFRNNQFTIVGTGSVTSDGSQLLAQIDNVAGGEAIALVPQMHSVSQADDQVGGVFVPSILGEGNLQTSYAIPSYSSLGAERAVSLVYNSQSANPEILISAEASFANSSRPQTLVTRIEAGGTLQQFEDHILVSGADRVSQQAIISGNDISSGRVPFKVLSTANYSCSKVTATFDDTIYINNQKENALGAGWTLPELQRLDVDENTVTIIDGTGTSTEFTNQFPEPIEESFDDGFGGWTVLNDVSSFTFEPTGGNPGGYLEFVDAAQGDVVFWSAPNEFADRLQDYVGGTISYDLQQSSTTRQFAFEGDIVINTSDPEVSLYLDFPTSENPGTAWTSYNIPLTTAFNATSNFKWGRYTASDDRLDFDLSEEEFIALLDDATNFLIRAEYRVGPETAGIDNVSLRPAVGTPEDVTSNSSFVVAASFEGDDGDFSRLFQGEDGTFIRRYPNGTQTVFNSEGRQTEITDRNGNTTQYSYDAEGRVTIITDPVGQETRFIYVARNLSSIIDPTGKETFFVYDTNGNLVRAENPEGEITSFDYDQNQRLIAQTDRRGLTTTHSYGIAGVYSGSERPDGTNISLGIAKSLGLENLGTTDAPRDAVAPENRMNRYVDGRGNESSTEVNGFGSPIRMTDALGRVTIYERNADNLVTAIIAPSSVTPSRTIRTEFEYDSNGYVIRKREAVGTALEREELYEYEPQFSRSIRKVDADGFETLMEYDANGNMIRMIDPLGGVEQMSYNSQGLVTSSTDKNGNVTRYEYDNFGRLERYIDPSLIATRLVLSPEGNILVQIEAEGTELERRIAMGYDSLNRKIVETAADGGSTGYEYNGNDDVISITDPTGIVETNSYDERNRLEINNDPATGATIMAYDEDSNIIRLTDAIGETTEFEYDAVDRLLSSVDARGQLRAFAYDLRDNITGITDARANISLITYDELDRTRTRSNPRNEIWAFEYDLRDNRVTTRKPDGTLISSTYDGLSRMTGLSGGDVVRSYSYDAQSNLLAANDNLNGIGGADLGFTYDQENRVGTASVANLFGKGVLNNSFTYNYDEHDRRATLIDSFGGNTAYDYDPVDRLTQVTTPQADIFTTNYDLAGRTLGRVAGNATEMIRQYEAATGRLSSQAQQQASGATFNGFDYNYTERGNIAAITEGGAVTRDRAYSYDELERLTDVSVPTSPSQDETYELDPEGNRLSSHLSDTHSTDEANRLESDESYTYVYDLNGNLVQRLAKAGTGLSDWAYRYDTLDQLIEVEQDSNIVERYRYDAFGRRSLIETVNETGSFDSLAIVTDGFDRAIDVRQGGAGQALLVRRYTHNANVDEPLQLETFTGEGRFDAAYTYHADHLGSIRYLTDESGTIVNAYDYDSYGRPLFGVTSFEQPFAYTGREWDAATGLYHYRARQYDAETGRFLQEDPIGFNAGDLNIYRYVLSNPLSYKDPSGLSAAGESAGTAGIVAGSASQLAFIGLRLNCIFTAIGEGLELAGNPNIDTLDIATAGINTATGCNAKATFKKKPKKGKEDKGKDTICPTCFAAGTLVHTREGLKPIEDIKVGDYVKSKNTETGEIAYKRVSNTHINQFDPVGVVSLLDETDGSLTHLSVTATHPIYHESKGWVHASLLSAGDRVNEDAGGTLKVTEVVFHKDAPINLTYNLEVSDFHTYFVGEDGVLVHNGKPCDCNKLLLTVLMIGNAVFGGDGNSTTPDSKHPPRPQTKQHCRIPDKRKK